MRLRQVVIAARDLAKVSDDLADVLGLGGPFADPGVGEFGLENAVFPVGDTFLEVVSPVKGNTAAGRFLERRGGDGGYMVILQTDDLDAARARVRDLGVRVVWQIELQDIATIHLHPRDVGAAILSLDAADPPASWRWAGSGWESRSRSDVTSAVVGAVLSAPDPDALAHRWASVLGLAVDAADGEAVIPLAGGRLRFASDPAREPGVAGFELAAPEPEAVLERARRRGVPVLGDAVEIGGTRLRLRAA